MKVCHNRCEALIDDIASVNYERGDCTRSSFFKERVFSFTTMGSMPFLVIQACDASDLPVSSVNGLSPNAASVSSSGGRSSGYGSILRIFFSKNLTISRTITACRAAQRRVVFSPNG